VPIVSCDSRIAVDKGRASTRRRTWALYYHRYGMGAAEKLQPIEAIWEKLGKSASDLLSPPWNGELFSERGRSAQKGSAICVAWA